MSAVSSGAGTLANTLLQSLTASVNFSVPAVDLDDPIFAQPDKTGPIYSTVDPVEVDDLTTGTVGGDGIFDKLMASLTVHLKVEYEAARISGAEYTKAYIGIVTAALQTAQTFLLTKDQTYWSALLAQAQAKAADVAVVTARVSLATARVVLAQTQFDASTSEANYALTKIKIATEDVTYGNLVLQGAGLAFTNANLLPAQLEAAETQTDMLKAQQAGVVFTNANVLPAQVAQMTAETSMTTAQKTGVDYTNASLLPAQLANTTAQTGMVTAQKTGVDYTNTNILPAQKAQVEAQTSGITLTNTTIIPKQAILLTEQAEVQHAQTSDKRLDGTTTITGAVGKQKALYDQQITSYKRDAETKVAKIFSDAWITQKTLDDGLTAPTQFTNTNVDAVLSAVRTANELD